MKPKTGKFIPPPPSNWSNWEDCTRCDFEGEMVRDSQKGVTCPQCGDNESFKGTMFNPDGTLMVSE